MQLQDTYHPRVRLQERGHSTASKALGVAIVIVASMPFIERYADSLPLLDWGAWGYGWLLTLFVSLF